MAENQVKKNNSRQDQLEMLRAMQKKLIMRAVLIVAVVLLTGVSFFALTAAWYTNIVGTDGLSFGAKQWNFTGEVKIANTSVDAAPGDSGIIPITIRNQGTEMAVASITTSKTGFSDNRMKQRVYFYVDAPLYRNGERMERVYVSAYSSYTYTLFPRTDLVLTQEQQDSHPLHWQWVYDVVGYYVMGRKDVSGNVTVEEYIRPIEYDFDIFTTTFDQDGNLLTVDGTKTAKELLEEVSAADGYAGIIDASQRPSGGYYPVSVKDGYGVWAYLCTYDEIVEHSEFDTQVGTGAFGQMQCPVVVTVTGSNSSSGGAVEVSNAETLAAILSTSTYASVKLTEDIRLNESIVLTEGSRIEIDLNGQTLSTSSDYAFLMEDGSKLTVHGGDDLDNPGVIQGNGAAGSIGIYSVGAEVELYNVHIRGVQEGLQIQDDVITQNAGSVIRIVDSIIDGSDDALWVFGSDKTTKIIIERSKLYGRKYIGINCNGNKTTTDITITDSEIVGYYAGVFHPQGGSVMTLQNCKITGEIEAGVVVKGGEVDIIDCKIYALGPFNDWVADDNGFAPSGSGVSIEANYEWDVTVNISGNTYVSSDNSDAIRLVKSNNYKHEAKFVITGGQYVSAVKANQSADADAVAINFDLTPHLAEGYEAKPVEDNNENIDTYVVEKANSGT